MGECEVDREMELKDKLYTLRKKKGYTQSELAEMLDVSRQSVSHWELGTIRPSTLRLKKLSELYSVPLEILLDDEADVQRYLEHTEVGAKEILEQENTEISDSLPIQKDRKNGRTKKKIVITVLGILLLIVIRISIYCITVARKPENSPSELEQFEKEKVVISSENGFDFQ